MIDSLALRPKIFLPLHSPLPRSNYLISLEFGGIAAAGILPILHRRMSSFNSVHRCTLADLTRISALACINLCLYFLPLIVKYHCLDLSLSQHYLFFASVRIISQNLNYCQYNIDVFYKKNQNIFRNL